MARVAGSVAVILAVVLTVGFFMFRPTTGAADPEPKPSEFASDRVPVAATPVPFDSKRVMGYLKDVCDIGPRVSGSAGMTRQQELLKKHFEALGAKVELQKFTARQNSRREPVPMANMIVTWHPERERRVILCAHYDTRPLADQEPDPRRWTEPFLSANDGGSGVAFLMEWAHHIPKLNTAVGVDFVLFDGEEYIFERRDRYFLGSEHFAAGYRRGKGKEQYIAAILLDMIAGKGAKFPVEPNSYWQARQLVEQVWEIAAELKCKAFLHREGDAVEDDHIALNRAGIPAIDIIDFSYRHWHRLSDVPENCGPEGMEQVSRVLSVWLQRVK